MKIEWIIVPFLSATLAGCGTNAKPKANVNEELISYSVDSNSNYTQIIVVKRGSKRKKLTPTPTIVTKLIKIKIQT